MKSQNPDFLIVELKDNVDSFLCANCKSNKISKLDSNIYLIKNIEFKDIYVFKKNLNSFSLNLFEQIYFLDSNNIEKRWKYWFCGTLMYIRVVNNNVEKAKFGIKQYFCHLGNNQDCFSTCVRTIGDTSLYMEQKIFEKKGIEKSLLFKLPKRIRKVILNEKFTFDNKNFRVNISNGRQNSLIIDTSGYE